MNTVQSNDLAMRCAFTQGARLLGRFKAQRHVDFNREYCVVNYEQIEDMLDHQPATLTHLLLNLIPSCISAMFPCALLMLSYTRGYGGSDPGIVVTARISTDPADAQRALAVFEEQFRELRHLLTHANAALKFTYIHGCDPAPTPQYAILFNLTGGPETPFYTFVEMERTRFAAYIETVMLLQQKARNQWQFMYNSQGHNNDFVSCDGENVRRWLRFNRPILEQDEGLPTFGFINSRNGEHGIAVVEQWR